MDLKMKDPMSVINERISVETQNVLILGTCFFFIMCSVNSMGFIEETVINSQAALPPVSTSLVSRHDGYTRWAYPY